jgi:hypothetical protein
MASFLASIAEEAKGKNGPPGGDSGIDHRKKSA